MITTAHRLFAASPTSERVVYELSRLRDFDDPRWSIVAIAAASVAILTLVCYLYRRDTVELRPTTGVFLALLRCVALVALLVFFLGIERRATREIVHNSQVAVLVDVSQSMALPAGDAAADTPDETRLESIVATLDESPLLAELRERHDVNVVRFDRRVQPVASLPKAESDRGTREGRDDDLPSPLPLPPSDIDWSAELSPRGAETRLGEAVEDQLRLYRQAPLAGLVVISDGVQNAGAEPTAAVVAAQEANVPIFTIGVGSTEPIRNLAVSDLLVPARAFPGDAIQAIGHLQSTGYAGQYVDVELLRRRSDEATEGGTLVASQRVQLGEDGKIVTVTFDIAPDDVGRFVYQLRAVAPEDDRTPRDDHREAEIEVVDRQTKVLLLAGGPSREYRFLRNQLYRDPTMQVDILLQTAQPGMSQEADTILSEFPDTREALFAYDAIVALDPDWRELDASQVDLLETWVAKEAGGMIVVPGPIHTAQWIRSTEQAKLRDMYPVIFRQRMTLLDDGHVGSDLGQPLEFEPAGRAARFLWLGDTADENELAWSSFEGVHGYYAVKGEKPGATVYARVTDYEALGGDSRPTFLASHFYGAGRVFYLGSGQFWRLRRVDPRYFEVLYTKLIRHVSQGRLLRGSARGALMVERDRYELGEPVVLRARLNNERHEPIEVPSVTAQLVLPDRGTKPVTMTADAEQPGIYVGQFAVHQEGTWQVLLPIPGAVDDPLSQFIQVRTPDRERAQSQRNVDLLTALAQQTKGRYYPQLTLATFGDDEVASLARTIASRTEVKLIKDAPDQDFARREMQWLLGIIAGALSLEWLIRRISRLA